MLAAPLIGANAIGTTSTAPTIQRWQFFLNSPIGGFTLLAVLLFFRIELPKRDMLTVNCRIKHIGTLCFFSFFNVFRSM